MSYCNLIKPSMLNATDFNLNQELKEKHLQYAKRHDRVILFHNNARSHVAESMKEGTWMGCLIPLVLFTRRCSFRFDSIDGAWSFRALQLF